MNHGILKLYKTILLLIVLLLFAGCLKSRYETKKLPNADVNNIDQHFPQKVIDKNVTILNNNDTKLIQEPIPTLKKQPIYKHSSVLDKQYLSEFTFDLVKKGQDNNNTLLIVGGIQGDEPGGFMAASIISTHYDITQGSVWVVPNLNFYSIIKRDRGPYGDMNRKFADLSKDDPEYEIIQRIKKYISDPHIKLIVNLHDGSGFYRPMYIDKMHQPLRWGQSNVIDQEILHNVEAYNDIYTISEEVVTHINKHLLKKEDEYRTKNTHTRFKKTFEEQEMSKTLTYFAVTHGKAAFGHETSKSLLLNERIYYKLLALEKYMDIMGIKYKRKFNLTLDGINSAMNDDINIQFDDTHITMPLKDIRNTQRYFPIKQNGIITYLPSNPLIKIIKEGNVYTVYYGNKVLTKLEADYTKHLNFDTKVKIDIDGNIHEIKFGDTINVKNNFLVIDEKRFRVNVIGYTNKSGIETNTKITSTMFQTRYSLEKNGKIYRIEFYQGTNFIGMILVKFIN